VSTKRAPKAKPLVPRQQKYLRARIGGKSKVEAARIAGYSEKNLAQSAYQAEKQMTGKVADLFDRHGLTDDAIIEKYLLPLLKAEETKFFPHNGKIVSRVNVRALSIRLAATRLIVEMKGMLKAEQENVAPGIKVVMINAQNRPPRPETPVSIPTVPGLPAPQKANPATEHSACTDQESPRHLLGSP
jgi:hypothetical protein